MKKKYWNISSGILLLIANCAASSSKVSLSVSSTIKYESKEAALEAYNRISKQPSTLDKAAELTKELDKRQIQKDEENARERAAKAAVENTANNLFAKFGTPTEESL